MKMKEIEDVVGTYIDAMKKVKETKPLNMFSWIMNHSKSFTTHIFTNPETDCIRNIESETDNSYVFAANIWRKVLARGFWLSVLL